VPSSCTKGFLGGERLLGDGILRKRKSPVTLKVGVRVGEQRLVARELGYGATWYERGSIWNSEITGRDTCPSLNSTFTILTADPDSAR
jgi:hypothetical protein